MDLNEKRSDEAAGKTDGKYLLNTVRADKYEVDGRRKKVQKVKFLPLARR